ncbi:HNH endonuclease [Alcaligenaceae bacterium LF4-65]|uniref:HNH endonuclease n=1 Tax=Zwartia hollandica TaxID=324606 RepID=A0A953NB05_9BURK|nr:HNH endonuclease [Zwartia hollandica]
MKRFFDKKQRSILAWVSGGRCQICREKLVRNFHADHVQAFVNGGKTVTNNGQALCQSCNLNKGAK